MSKRKNIVVMIIITLCCVAIAYLNSNYYHSKKLVSAIKEENIIEIQQIVVKNPGCINTYPTFAPVWCQDLMDIFIEYPLGEACLIGNVEIIEILVENGADVNLGSRVTPLALTYYKKPHNWYNISLFLLESGASPDYKSPHPEGNVLTDIVMSRPGIFTSKYGRESDSEVNKAFYYTLENCDHSKIKWMRVLQHSTTNDRVEIVKFLLDEGYCDVNDTSVGMTALMFAARDSTQEMVQLLLDYGADKSIVDSDGKTAYDYAMERGFTENAEILKP